MMEMNVGKLREELKNLPDEMPVFVACEGYCNFDFAAGTAKQGTDTFAIVHDGKLVLTDENAVDDDSGHTI